MLLKRDKKTFVVLSMDWYLRFYYHVHVDCFMNICMCSLFLVDTFPLQTDI